MWQIVRELVADGVTILLTTQYLEEADRLADRIALLDHGRIVAEGTPSELKRLVPGGASASSSPTRRSSTGPPTLLGGAKDDEALALNLASDGGSIPSHRARPARRRVRGRRRPCREVRRPRRRVPVADGPSRRRGGSRAMTAYLVTDSATMLRRSLRRMRRYPSLTFFIAIIPVLLLLLFTFVLGGTLGAGLGGAAIAGGRDAYVAYVTPGILLMTAAGAAQGTAISVAMDMTEGIIARFRTMSIARASVLAGHVVGSVIQAILALAIVLVVALLIGFRPTTGPLEWLAAFGLFVLTAIAIVWLSVGMGL